MDTIEYARFRYGTVEVENGLKNSKKRRAETLGDTDTHPIPRLIDNKRKHMEGN